MQAVDRREVDRQLAVADRLEHLDRRHVGEGLGERAVVLQPDVDAVGQAGCGGALAGERGLLLGQGDPGDAGAEPARGVQREAAPAAADLEHVRVGSEAELLADAPVLGLLRLLERHRGILEDGARVRPGRIEEERVEVVAEVVVVLDVAPGAGQVGAGRQARPPPLQLHQQRCGRPRADVLGGDREDLEQPHQVVGPPVAGDVRLADREAAPGGEAAPQVLGVDRHGDVGAGGRIARGAHRAVGQAHGDAPARGRSEAPEGGAARQRGQRRPRGSGQRPQGASRGDGRRLGHGRAGHGRRRPRCATPRRARTGACGGTGPSSSRA